MFIPDPDLDFFPIPDPGVKNAPDPGSGSATRLTKIKEAAIWQFWQDPYLFPLQKDNSMRCSFSQLKKKILFYVFAVLDRMDWVK
jgi:hypothetical protein